jgi:hypothetical protein
MAQAQATEAGPSLPRATVSESWSSQHVTYWVAIDQELACSIAVEITPQRGYPFPAKPTSEQFRQIFRALSRIYE